MAYRPPQRRSPQQGGAFIITLSVLTAIFFLLGVAMLWLAVQAGLRLSPTPTPTATARATYTPSPDARATHITEDMLTQVAVAATLITQLTAAPPPPIAATPASIATAAGTVVVQIPYVSSDNGQPTSPLSPPNGNQPPDQGLAPTASAVFMPNTTNGQPNSPLPTPGLPPPFPSPLPTPGSGTPGMPATPVPTVATVIPPTATPTLLPPTPTPLPATPTYAPVSQLAAVLRTDIAKPTYTLRVGPSNVYTVAGTLAQGTAIQLRGRTQTGDWVYACCVENNVSAWVRTAYVTIANNPFPAYATATPGVNPNDPSWLTLWSIDPILTPRPIHTPIPYTDFPLPRYDIGNTGWVPQLPPLPMQSAWGNNPQAAGSFISPVAVREQSVLVVNDDRHLYSLFANGGNQRWIYEFNGPLPTLAPALQDEFIYLVAGSSMTALRDLGGGVEVSWQGNLEGDATTPFMIWQDTLFIGRVAAGNHELVALRRFNNGDRKVFDAPNAPIQLPAIGQEMVFVGADRLWAVDANMWEGVETIWTSNDVVSVAAPPVYSYPGVVHPAELYVADAGGNVHALDANTGIRFLAPYYSGGTVTALAVNDKYLYIVGNNVLQAVGRNDLLYRWRQPVTGAVRGGPFVTADRVLVVLEGGGIQVFDAVAGTPLGGATTPGVAVPASPAIGGGVIFVPGNKNSVYAFRGP